MRPILVFCALLAACSHRTAEEQLIKDVAPAKAWVATLRFAGEKWIANSVPTAFVRSSLGAAEKEFDRAMRSVDQSNARRDLRDQLRHHLEGSHAAAERLKNAIEKQDRRAAAAAIDGLQ
jgi:hypothetical protein